MSTCGKMEPNGEKSPSDLELKKKNFMSVSEPKCEADEDDDPSFTATCLDVGAVAVETV